MWTADYSQSVAATTDRVWAVLSDVEGWAEWNDGVASIVLDGPVAVGSTFVMTPPGEDPITSTLVTVEPGVEISDLTDFEGLRILVRHQLHAEGEGTSRAVYRIEVDGAAPEDVQEEVGRQVSGDFPEVLANLAARCAGR